MKDERDYEEMLARAVTDEEITLEMASWALELQSRSALSFGSIEALKEVHLAEKEGRLDEVLSRPQA